MRKIWIPVAMVLLSLSACRTVTVPNPVPRALGAAYEITAIEVRISPKADIPESYDTYIETALNAGALPEDALAAFRAFTKNQDLADRPVTERYMRWIVTEELILGLKEHYMGEKPARLIVYLTGFSLPQPLGEQYGHISRRAKFTVELRNAESGDALVTVRNLTAGPRGDNAHYFGFREKDGAARYEFNARRTAQAVGRTISRILTGRAVGEPWREKIDIAPQVRSEGPGGV